MPRKTLKVFEHQTIRVGDRIATARGTQDALRAADLDALARFNDAHGGRFVSIGHRRVTFRNFVGYIQIGDLGIEILPKADRHSASDVETAHWRNGLLKMLEVALGIRLESPTAAAQSTTRSTLLDLVAMRFLEKVERLTHEGLAKGYRDEEANGTVFRGRLMMTENLRHNVARPDRLYVRHQVFDRDILVNQIIGSALTALTDLPLSASVAAASARCRATFPEVGALAPSPRLFERVALGRSTARYQDAIVFARMILDQYAPQLRSGPVPVFSLLFDMNVLWERYVAALFRKTRAPGLIVSTQSSVGFWKPTGESSRTLRPDIVVRADQKPLLVVDTKWKVPRDGSPSDDDLKQMFAYNELLGAPRALLVYPSTHARPEGKQGAFADRAHRCGTLYLGLFDARGWSAATMQREVDSLVAELCG